MIDILFKSILRHLLANKSSNIKDCIRIECTFRTVPNSEREKNIN